ncbi:MAG: hypothetical protein H7Y89_09050 [Steroidobacteraceae bacterium]|nr:hypothetical protein [Steroidobacteraceae bacterium]
MRLALVVVLSLVLSGCALWRKDREEPVDNEPRKAKAEPVLMPSEALKPESLEIASPVTDHFFMRATYYQPSVTTELRLDSANGANDGTVLNAEEDLGLDDVINQGRVEFNVRMGERNHLRVDFFKLSRFHEQQLPRAIEFGDFTFAEGTLFRSSLDWRVFSLTHTYSFFRGDRFEAGLGLGVHIIQAKASGGQPGTLNRESESEVGIFPTIAASAALRLTKRFSITARGQSFSASPEGFEGTMSEYHIDLQYRWRKNLAFGIGYTQMVTELEVIDADTPLLFNMDTTGPEIFVRASF